MVINMMIHDYQNEGNLASSRKFYVTSTFNSIRNDSLEILGIEFYDCVILKKPCGYVYQ